MKKITTILPAIFSLLLCSGSICHADAYSWVDKDGKLIYGSQKPKGVKYKSLKTRKLSRYSSSRVLKRVGHKDAQQRSQQASQQSSARSKLSSNTSTTTASDSGDNNWSFVAAELSHETPDITYNSQNEVKDCRVFVNNENDYLAAEVSVAFEFADGSLIPAIGPGELAANSSAEFLISEEFLPLAVGNASSESKPKVILHGYRR